MTEILVKVESFNPTGSIKDRADLYMIEGAKIGANAVVLKDLSAYSKAVGIPARIINKT